MLALWAEKRSPRGLEAMNSYLSGVRPSLLLLVALCATAAAVPIADRTSRAGTIRKPSHKREGRFSVSQYEEVEELARSTRLARRLQQGYAGPNATGMFTSITIPLDVCGYTQSIPYERLSGQVLGTPWNDTSASADLNFTRSLATFFDKCSYGALELANNASLNRVLNQSVPVRGSSICLANQQVDCSNVDAIAQEAEQYASQELGIDMTQYSVRILVFPPDMPGCPSIFLGRVGCFTNQPDGNTPSRLCRTWVNSGNVRGLVNMVGYNLGLMQAGKGDELTGDWTSGMNSGGYFCYNAYHSHLLGWAFPVETLNITNTTAGNWTTVQLPPRALNASNYLLLASSNRDLYVSYTAPVGWEQNSGQPDLGRKLLVHSKKSDDDVARSDLRALLGAGEQAAIGSAFPKWVVRLAEGPTLDGAYAQVCRANEDGQCAASTAPTPGNSTSNASNRTRLRRRLRSGRLTKAWSLF